MKRRCRGFTLLELTVTLLVTGLILLLAIQLLTEVQATLVQWQRTAPDPLPQFAIKLLRTDIQRSRSTQTPPGNGPLRLDMPDGSSVTYDEVLGELLRVVQTSDGSVEGQRVLMNHVRSWSWHDSLAPGLIEVRVIYRRHRDPGWRRFGGLSRIRDEGLENDSLTVRFARRIRPGRSAW